MNTEAIIQKVSKHREQRRNREFLDDFLAEVKAATWRQGRFTIPGFAFFVVKKTKARSILNPQTGAVMQLPARKTVKARAAKEWRAR